jgi:hypothetical protein
MAFKPKSKKKEIEYKIPDAHFELIIADADTPLFQAAKFVQEDYVVVTHKPSGRKMEFNNKTEFYGHWKKKEGGWLSKKNEKRVEKGLDIFSADDFSIEECARLSSEIDDHLEEAIKSFDFFVGRLRGAVSADDYLLCIGGEGNFRYDVAKILPYKGDRKEKPILFQEVKEAVIDKYGTKIEVVDGEEADDRLGQYGWKNYLNYKKTGDWKYCLSYIDKDLNMIISPSFNYDKIEDGIKYTTENEASYAFCVQLLCGDKSTDNIQGLPNFTEEIIEKYKLKKSRGIGKATAQAYLRGCEGDVKLMFERIVEAYKSYYGDSYEWVTHTEEMFTWSWLQFLRENSILLYMRRKQDEMYDIEKTLKRLNIEL